MTEGQGDAHLIRMLDRLLLFLYSFALFAAAIWLIIAASGGFAASYLIQFIDDLTGGSRPIQAATIGAAVVVLLISLRFIVVSLRRNGPSTPSINQRTEFGDIRISVETVENLALKAAAKTRGVKDLKARVRVTEAGLEIMVRAFIEGEGSIPALSEEIQRTVSVQVEEATGIPVAEVSVYIANVTQSAASFKSRVE